MLGPNEFKRAEAVLKENIDMIVVDTAHGHTKKVAEIIKFIKKRKKKKLLYVQEILLQLKLQNICIN